MDTRFLIDCDGILSNFIDPCLEHVNRILGTSFKHDEVNQWDIFEALDVQPQVAEEVFDLMKLEGACSALPLYEGAKEGVAKLREMCDVYVVTSPMSGPHWAHERERWLLKHFGIAASHVISTPAKYCVAGDFLLEDQTP